MVQLASLVALIVVAWYVRETSGSLVRIRAFMDARDIDYRKDRIDDARARSVRVQSIDTWLRDTRAIWGKMFSATERLRALGEELVAPDRKTVEMRSSPAPTEALPVDDAGDRSAQIAAGIGPRPLPASKRAASMVSTRRPPPMTVEEPASSGLPSRRATPARFPGTMMSMQAVAEPGSAPPSPACQIAPIETKEVCRECDEGLVRVGVGGVGKCRECKGTGFIDIGRAKSSEALL